MQNPNSSNPFGKFLIIVMMAILLVVASGTWSVGLQSMYLSNESHAISYLSQRGYTITEAGGELPQNLIASFNDTYVVGNSTNQWATSYTGDTITHDLTPWLDSVYVLGTNARHYLSGWIDTLHSITGLFTTVNTTNLNATTANVATMYAPSVNSTSINASGTILTNTLNATQANITTLNTTNLNMSGDILPTTSITRNIGSSVLQLLTGWFKTLFVTSLNATSANITTLNATTINATTLNAPTGRGALLVASVNATILEKTQADYYCNGISDEVVIKTALLAGNNVFLSSGNFVFADNITISNGQKLSGISEGLTTVLYPTGNNNTSVIVIGGGSSVTEKGNTLSDMTIDATSVGYGVWIQSGLHNSLDRLDIRGAVKDGVMAVGASSSYRPDYTTITRSWIHLNGGNGIFLGINVNAMVINGDHISDNGNGANITAGVSINGSQDHTISNSFLWQNARANIIVASAFNIRITGNDMESPQFENIWLRNTSFTVPIIGNTITEASLSGTNNASSIVIGAAPSEEANQIIISGNTFLDTSGKMKYWVSGAGGGGTGVFTGNTFRGVPATGLWALDSTSFNIRDNRGQGGVFKTENYGSGVGTGIQQAIAHGMGTFTPTNQMVQVFSDNFTGVAFQTANPSATEIFITATNNSAYHWIISGN
jgi:hypothetical protein